MLRKSDFDEDIWNRYHHPYILQLAENLVFSFELVTPQVIYDEALRQMAPQLLDWLRTNLDAINNTIIPSKHDLLSTFMWPLTPDGSINSNHPSRETPERSSSLSSDKSDKPDFMQIVGDEFQGLLISTKIKAAQDERSGSEKASSKPHHMFRIATPTAFERPTSPSASDMSICDSTTSSSPVIVQHAITRPGMKVEAPSPKTPSFPQLARPTAVFGQTSRPSSSKHMHACRRRLNHKSFPVHTGSSPQESPLSPLCSTFPHSTLPSTDPLIGWNHHLSSSYPAPILPSSRSSSNDHVKTVHIRRHRPRRRRESTLRMSMGGQPAPCEGGPSSNISMSLGDSIAIKHELLNQPDISKDGTEQIGDGMIAGPSRKQTVTAEEISQHVLQSPSSPVLDVIDELEILNRLDETECTSRAAEIMNRSDDNFSSTISASAAIALSPPDESTMKDGITKKIDAITDYLDEVVDVINVSEQTETQQPNPPTTDLSMSTILRLEQDIDPNLPLNGDPPESMGIEDDQYVQGEDLKDLPHAEEVEAELEQPSEAQNSHTCPLLTLEPPGQRTKPPNTLIFGADTSNADTPQLIVKIPALNRRRSESPPIPTSITPTRSKSANEVAAIIESAGILAEKSEQTVPDPVPTSAKLVARPVQDTPQIQPQTRSQVVSNEKSEKDSQSFMIECIIAETQRKVNGKMREEVKVKWHGYSLNEASWIWKDEIEWDKGWDQLYADYLAGECGGRKRRRFTTVPTRLAVT